MVQLLTTIGLSITYHIDMIEVNDFKTGEGYSRQIILWEWSPEYRRYDVIDWTMEISELPINKTIIFKGKKIKAKTVIYTKTEYDPEIRNRSLHPENMRRKL